MSTHRPDAALVWSALWRTTKLLEVHARASVSATGLALSDFGVLEVLLHQGPLTVSALKDWILISSGSTTTSIDRLERQGLVHRELAGPDRRSRTVHLTPEGRGLIESLYATHRSDMEQAFDCVSNADMAHLLTVLHRITVEEQGHITHLNGGAQ